MNISPEEMRELNNELIDKFDILREKYEKQGEREVPLPRILYHVTLKESARDIINDGIKPSSLMFGPEKVVSLSDDIDFAVEVVCKQHNIPIEEAKKRLVVFEVETGYKGGGMERDKFKNYLRKADPEAKGLEAGEIHEVHYEGEIPPEAIEIDSEWNGVTEKKLFGS